MQKSCQKNRRKRGQQAAFFYLLLNGNPCRIFSPHEGLKVGVKKFRIGSITKQFTLMLFMQLVEKGKINLNGKVSDYLPYYRKDTGDKILAIKNYAKSLELNPDNKNAIKMLNKIMKEK